MPVSGFPWPWNLSRPFPLPSGRGRTPLHLVVDKGSMAMIGLLLHHGASLEAQDKPGPGVSLHVSYSWGSQGDGEPRRVA